MDGVQPVDHVAAVLLVLLAVFVRHQRAVLPECKIAGDFKAAVPEQVSPAGFGQDVLFVADIPGNGIVARGEECAGVGHSRVVSAVDIEAAAAGHLP